ncbi:hypothetical protein BDN72DRAFT_766053 [Pluteus cervinus]|uniref:Uncharacterized protein n=1 Tax=Pluteus cervinus TaxID=181527 RepID=A0ACD3AYE5_9AGAR|nr:hypothetical protein BDN72DRAFT_766053 [Pluteus cervinus]
MGYSYYLRRDERGGQRRVRQDAGDPPDTRPTPAPTGDPSSDTTVHINDETDFSLILPRTSGVLISDSENDGIAFGDSSNPFAQDFILAAAIQKADDDSWLQVTGCIDPSKAGLSSQDSGGQYDVRFPNGAQCTFGGYGASFIQQVEPEANRFCLRCCHSENDQINCNSHQDRAGCLVAVPGQYAFPDKNVDCSG